ncbi:hypothetical protein DOTSEDRAFT_18883 [Dothistroma septosporum NZE10]|uniref:Uncharacterized protein n=1 Tax=Dothistroma septosporum (strain NZE10 / CBS 128990) TaxID=675120 RepID=N1PY25_DOTSN|nr:hypothetical protein DOTSEDRAFT_18883 [Dothistroma septosporum NZE10]
MPDPMLNSTHQNHIFLHTHSTPTLHPVGLLTPQSQPLHSITAPAPNNTPVQPRGNLPTAQQLEPTNKALKDTTVSSERGRENMGIRDVPIPPDEEIDEANRLWEEARREREEERKRGRRRRSREG